MVVLEDHTEMELDALVFSFVFSFKWIYITQNNDTNIHMYSKCTRCVLLF